LREDKYIFLALPQVQSVFFERGSTGKIS